VRDGKGALDPALAWEMVWGAADTVDAREDS
jgi:hypothetical protein